MSTTPRPCYTGYYTGRILWRKEQCWGGLHFSASGSSLLPEAEGGAFRRNHKLYVTIGGGTSRTVVKTDGAPRYEGRDVIGHVSFIPAERRNQGSYRGRMLECLALEIPPEWMAKSFGDCEISSVEFFPVTNRFDPLIFNIMSAIREETEIGGPGARLFAETAATLIALHLIRRYSNGCDMRALRKRPAMAARAFERTIEFMEANLDSQLSIEALAKIANMPVSSFLHGFRDTMRISPHKFLMRRRIEHAQRLLKASNRPIADIAYQLGFSSQSHFSTVFRKGIGETPARYRRYFRLK